MNKPQKQNTELSYTAKIEYLNNIYNLKEKIYKLEQELYEYQYKFLIKMVENEKREDIEYLNKQK